MSFDTLQDYTEMASSLLDDPVSCGQVSLLYCHEEFLNKEDIPRKT